MPFLAKTVQLASAPHESEKDDRRPHRQAVMGKGMSPFGHSIQTILMRSSCGQSTVLLPVPAKSSLKHQRSSPRRKRRLPRAAQRRSFCTTGGSSHRNPSLCIQLAYLCALGLSTSLPCSRVGSDECKLDFRTLALFCAPLPSRLNDESRNHA